MATRILEIQYHVSTRLSWRLILLALSFAFASSCATNYGTSNVLPGIDLSEYKSIYVAKSPDDKRGVNVLIADQLVSMGYDASTGERGNKPDTTQAIIKYQDIWIWDFTMFMIELNIQLFEAKSDLLLASASSFHSSLTRKSAKDMVDESLTSLFALGETRYSSNVILALRSDRMTIELPEVIPDQLPISVSISGFGVGAASDDAFEAALLESARRSGIFREIASDENAEYSLTVSLLNITPNFAQTHVLAKANWFMLKRSNQEVVLNAEIAAEHSKAFSIRADAEGAIREVISVGLDKVRGREW